MLVERLGRFGFVVLLVAGGLVTGSWASGDDAAKRLEKALEPDGLYVVIETTFGTLACRLEFERAPVTVGSFIGLAEGRIPFRDPSSQKLVTRRFYDGLKFHRVVRDFVVSGGDPLGDGTAPSPITPPGLLQTRPSHQAAVSAITLPASYERGPQPCHTRNRVPRESV